MQILSQFAVLVVGNTQQSQRLVKLVLGTVKVLMPRLSLPEHIKRSGTIIIPMQWVQSTHSTGIHWHNQSALPTVTYHNEALIKTIVR